MGERRVYTGKSLTHVRFAAPSISLQRGDRFGLETVWDDKRQKSTCWLMTPSHRLEIGKKTYAVLVSMSDKLP